MSNLPQINFLPGQHFECTACGKCCKGAWNIAVDDESFTRIKSSQSYEKRKKEGYIPLMLADNKASVGRKESGGCVFLSDDDLCDIHGELGLENKPLVCQTYPNMLTNTPEGYFVSLSFACPAVLNNAGVPMEEKRDRLAHTLAVSGTAVPQNVPIAGEVELAAGITISWEEYKLLEQHMLVAFKPQQPAKSLLGMAETLSTALINGEVNSLIENGFGAPRHSDYSEQLLEVFSVNCISIMELEKEPEERVDFMGQLMTHEGVTSPRHGCHLPAFSAQPKAQPRDLALIHYYFQNIVFGKRLTNGSLLNGLLTLAVGMALLVYYLEVFRQCHKEQTARELAFELIEGDVVTHSRGLNVLMDELPKAMLSHLVSLDKAA
jgi:Fe-S-cluster containining protein